MPIINCFPSTAYAALTQDDRFVKIAQYFSETWYSEPKDYFAHGGTLARLLMEGHEGVDTGLRKACSELSTGSISTRRSTARIPGTRTSGGSRTRAGKRHCARTFARGSAMNWPQQPFAALVNVALPDESRILKAPLAAGSRRLGTDARRADGGAPTSRSTGRCASSCKQPSSRCLITTLPAPAAATRNVACLSCWVRKVQEERQRRIAAAR